MSALLPLILQERRYSRHPVTHSFAKIETSRRVATPRRLFSFRPAPLRPIIKVAERLQIRCIESVEHCFQLGTRISKHGESLALDQRAKPTRKPFRECLQVRNRSGGIGVSFVDMDDLTIFAHKALVTQNAGLTSRHGHHLAGQCSEIAELPRFDSQLDAPRNLPAHAGSPPTSSYQAIEPTHDLRPP